MTNNTGLERILCRKEGGAIKCEALTHSGVDGGRGGEGDGEFKDEMEQRIRIDEYLTVYYSGSSRLRS